MSLTTFSPPKPKLTLQQFRLAQHNANSETRRALDAFTNPAARLGWGSSNLLEGTEYPLTRLSFQYLLLQSLYRSNWVARKVVDVVAEDLLKNWVRLDLDAPPAQLKRFEKTIDETGTRNQMLTTVKWARLFGGAAAVIILEGQDDLTKPLDLDSVELNSYRGLIPLDRWCGIYPSGNLCGDINRPLDFGLPEFYQVSPNQGSSFNIHSSRIIRFIGRDVPVWEKQVEMYWGVSVIEPMYDELKKFDNTSWNMASLVFRANVLGLRQKDLSQMLSGLSASPQAAKNFYASLQAQSALLSNQGFLVLPEEGGIEQRSYSFGGLRDVYESFKENICGASDGIPYSRMFGRPPGGLATTNEGDEHAYYENIGTRQNTDVEPQMLKLMPIIAMSTWGKVPKDFGWTYNPVRSLSNETQTTLAKDKTSAVVEAYNAGLISQKTALLEMQQQADETGMWSNISDEDIESANEEVIGGEMDLGMESPLGESAPMSEKKTVAQDEAARLGPSGYKSANEGFGRILSRYKKQAEKQGPDAVKAAGLDENPDIERRVALPYGLTAYIENEAGTVRRGDGWQVTMKHPYGYLADTQGRDGDAVDCFLGPHYATADTVYVIHTAGEDKEDKLIIGVNSAAEAQQLFLDNYNNDKHFGSMDKFALRDLPAKLERFKGRKIA